MFLVPFSIAASNDYIKCVDTFIPIATTNEDIHSLSISELVKGIIWRPLKATSVTFLIQKRLSPNKKIDLCKILQPYREGGDGRVSLKVIWRRDFQVKGLKMLLQVSTQKFCTKLRGDFCIKYPSKAEPAVKVAWSSGIDGVSILIAGLKLGLLSLRAPFWTVR